MTMLTVINQVNNALDQTADKTAKIIEMQLQGIAAVSQAQTTAHQKQLDQIQAIANRQLETTQTVGDAAARQLQAWGETANGLLTAMDPRLLKIKLQELANRSH